MFFPSDLKPSEMSDKPLTGWIKGQSLMFIIQDILKMSCRKRLLSRRVRSGFVHRAVLNLLSVDITCLAVSQVVGESQLLTVQARFSQNNVCGRIA